MEQVDQAKFSCQSCGKSYKWKPEFAGKKVKCKCGFVMTAPMQPPGAAPAPSPSDEPDLDALYDLADEGKQAVKSGTVAATFRCPSCQASLEPGVGLCPECGFNLKTGKKASAKATPVAAGATLGAPSRPGGGVPSALAAYGAPKRGLQKDAPRDDKMDLYASVGLVGGGVALMVLKYMWFNPTNEPLLHALMYSGIHLIISFVLVAIAAVFMIKWAEMAFGDPAMAALKIAGAVIGPAAIAMIVSYLLHDIWGLVGFFLAFGMIFVIYHYLFEFDMSEKWIIAGVTTIVCMFATPALFEMMVHSNPGMMASKGAKNEDASIDYVVTELGHAKNAREWINDNKGRCVGDMPREDSAKLIDDLYALPGVTEVWIYADGPQAAEIYIKLPRNSKQRQGIFDFQKSFAAKHGKSAIPDEGAKWMNMRFLFISRPEPVSAF